MFKFVMMNMACGHCHLKIDAELKSAGYDIEKINMDTNTITLNTDISNFPKIIRVLGKINYFVDPDYLPETITKYQIVNKKIEDDNVLNSIFLKLSELNIINYDFDFNEDILELECTEDEYKKVKLLIESIEVDL
ncbi:MAG: hypothetical protein QM489_04165 [Candidatus Izemoplasma sp.]